MCSVRWPIRWWSSSLDLFGWSLDLLWMRTLKSGDPISTLVALFPVTIWSWAPFWRRLRRHCSLLSDRWRLFCLQTHQLSDWWACFSTREVFIINLHCAANTCCGPLPPPPPHKWECHCSQICHTSLALICEGNYVAPISTSCQGWHADPSSRGNLAIWCGTVTACQPWLTLF